MIRQPAVSGSFYPNRQNDLQRQVAQLLNGTALHTETAPKMLIVPHAGYVYSGATAAAAYRQLMPYADQYRRVVIAGPAHRVGFEGIALSSAKAFNTPLGKVLVDNTWVSTADQPWVHIFDEAHLLEHSLEVQLPFLKTVLNEFTITPLVVGQCALAKTRQTVEALWGGDETLWVISTDLSHFLAYPDAQFTDDRSITRILNMEADLTGHEACGHYPLNGALAVARHKHLAITELARCNSGDISGDRHRVVGYAAFVLNEMRGKHETYNH